MTQMAETNRRTRAAVGALVVAVVAGLLVWLLWPSGEPATRDARPEAAPSPADETTPAAKRTPRVRETAAPAAPDATQAPSAPAKPGEAPPPTLPFEVTVLRSDGTPAAGSSVRLVDPTADDWNSVVASAETDARGVATMRVHDETVRVVAWLGAEAQAPVDLVSLGDHRAVTIRLAPAVRARGRVVLPGGEPAPGADVAIVASPWFGNEYGLTLTTKADADGRFELPPVVLAGMNVNMLHEVRARTADLATGSEDLDLDHPDAELVVRLVAGFTVRGRFVDAAGKPIEGVEIRIEGSERKIASDGDGRVSLRLPYGTAKLVALRNSGKTVVCGIDDGNFLVQQWKASRALGSFGETDGDADFADTTLAPSAPLSGCIVDRAGNAIERAFVTVYLGAVNVGTALAGKDGRFSLPVDGADAFDLYVNEYLPDESTDHPRSASVRGVHGGEEIKIVLEAKLRIDVRFLDAADRTPVASTYIGAKAWHHGEKYPCVEWQGMSTAPGDDGAAVIVPTPGSYDIEIRAAGFEPERVEGVEVVEGRSTPVDLLLRRKHE
jgi:hypothetical protein